MPHALKKATIIAVLKPTKPNDQPQSYRPIALLSMIYKPLERLIYNRIKQPVYENIPSEQAGFSPNRSCTGQVFSLTIYIEAGFQRKLKTSAVFIDLTAAYDTVWRQGLIRKMLNIIPCLKTANLLDQMLSNRPFQVLLENSQSRKTKLSNGLPQGSVLAPLLFNLYIADMPKTTSI